jgi:hypothetical protein
VPEVEPWGQTGGGLKVRVVAVFVVPLKPSVEELPPSLVSRHAAAFHVRHRSHLVVDVECFQRLCANPVSFSGPPDEFQRCPWGIRFFERQIDETFIDVRQPNGWGQREFYGHVCEMVFDGFVEVPS